MTPKKQRPLTDAAVISLCSYRIDRTIAVEKPHVEPPPALGQVAFSTAWMPDWFELVAMVARERREAGP